MTHGSLFSGIGGFDLASEWMGWENKFHCEWNEFGQKVLHHYWPGAELFTDIKKSNFKKYANQIDILTGGFPCQPYSQAGKRKGKEDERHLWPEMLRAIKEIQPSWIVGENVLGLVNWSGGLVFHEVQTDLEAEGYEVWPYVLPAAAVNAPHRRDRVWFVAYNHNFRCKRFSKQTSDRTNSEEQIRDNQFCKEQGWNEIRSINEGDSQDSGNASDSIRQRSESSLSTEANVYGYKSKWENFPTVSPICNGNDGISNRLDSITFPKWRNESIKAGGNAIVPQVVYQIFKSIQQYEELIMQSL